MDYINDNCKPEIIDVIDEVDIDGVVVKVAPIFYTYNCDECDNIHCKHNDNYIGTNEQTG